MNVDDAEIGKFEALAHRWWDPQGDFRTLHDINPLRLDYIAGQAPLDGARVVDVGCGGGILSESMAAAGARVTAIDMAEKPLAVARLHARETGTRLEYLAATPEDLAAERPGAFDTVTCMEMLEHVPDYASSVAACADLAVPGGHLFFSTISRTPKAFLLAVLGAEYVLNILPRGTHDYARLIRPSELARAVRRAGLRVEDVTGMAYNPFSHRARMSRDTDVNYLLRARKP